MGTETQGGGFYGWRLLFFLWVVYTIPVGFVFYGPPVLYPFMIEATGWSRGEIMVGFAAMGLCGGLTSPIIAWMIGRLGARLTLFIGGVTAAVVTSLIGLVGHIYPVYLILCALLGFGTMAASMIPVQTVIVFWFSARRALALGVVLGGGAIGGFFAPQIVNAAVLGAGGDWRIGWLIIAVASVIGAVVAIVTVRNRPADMGQYADGLPPDEAEAMGPRTSRATRTYRTPVSWTVRDALKTRALWFLVVGAFGSFFIWEIILSQGPLHLRDRGFDPTGAAFLYTLPVLVSILGRFAVAALGDIIEPRFLFACSTLCLLVGGILFWFVSPDAMWVAYLYALLAGVGFGALYICEVTIVGNYWGPEAFAGIRGVIAPVGVLFGAMIAPLAGYLYDLQGSYFTILLVSWIAAIVGFVAILLCAPPRPKGEADAATHGDGLF